MNKKEKLEIRKRREALETEKLLKEGYSQKSLTISLIMANLLALFTALPGCILIVWLYLQIKNITFSEISDIIYQASFLEFILTFVLCDVLIVIHELIHGLFMYLFNGHKKEDIHYELFTLTPFCSCQVPLKKFQYLIVLIMPALTLSIVCLAIALILNSYIALCLSVLMWFGGGGDFTIILMLLKEKTTKNAVILDSSNKCGCELFDKK